MNSIQESAEFLYKLLNLPFNNRQKGNYRLRKELLRLYCFKSRSIRFSDLQALREALKKYGVLLFDLSDNYFYVADINNLRRKRSVPNRILQPLIDDGDKPVDIMEELYETTFGGREQGTYKMSLDLAQKLFRVEQFDLQTVDEACDTLFFEKELWLLNTESFWVIVKNETVQKNTRRISDQKFKRNWDIETGTPIDGVTLSVSWDYKIEGSDYGPHY